MPKTITLTISYLCNFILLKLFDIERFCLEMEWGEWEWGLELEPGWLEDNWELEPG